MAKLTLSDLASLTNQTSAIATINANSALIETALENTLSRDGTSPNTMAATLDMDSNRIINLPEPSSNHEPVRLIDLDSIEPGVGGIGGSAGVTDNRIIRSDGTGGATIQTSAIGIDDSGNLLMPASSVIKFNTTDVLLTHSTDALTMTGGDLVINARATSATSLTLNQFSTSATVPVLNLGVGVGSLFSRPTTSSLNSVKWSMLVNQNPYTGSGVGGEDYNNEVVVIGWNLSNTIGINADTSKSGIWDAWEYKFNATGTAYYHERHMQQRTSAGTDKRFFSILVPHNGVAANSFCNIELDHVYFGAYDGTDVFEFNNSAKQFLLSGGVRIINTTNNTNLIEGYNAAANDTIPIVKISASDQIYLSPNGVAPIVIGAGLIAATQTLTGAGAVNLTTLTTKVVTTGANALTLAAGTDGQIKIITMITDGGDGTLTPTNFGNGTTITFNDVYDTVMLQYVNSKWVIISNSGATVA